MENLRFFDCNSMIGARQVKNPGSYYKFDEFIRKMDYYGIDNALVCHSTACKYQPMMGNRLLMDEIKDYPNLRPMWAVMPHHTGEFPEPGELRSLLRDNNVPAVTMLPRDNSYSLDEWICGDLFSMLAESRVPLVISYHQVSFGQLHSIMTSHPELRVILTNMHYNSARNLYPMLSLFEHLYIETIGFKVHGGIEDVCRKFGARRLVFGTCAPTYAGSAAIGMVTYARISMEEKRRIASENLERLLEGVKL